MLPYSNSTHQQDITAPSWRWQWGSTRQQQQRLFIALAWHVHVHNNNDSSSTFQVVRPIILHSQRFRWWFLVVRFWRYYGKMDTSFHLYPLRSFFVGMPPFFSNRFKPILLLRTTINPNKTHTSHSHSHNSPSRCRQRHQQRSPLLHLTAELSFWMIQVSLSLLSIAIPTPPPWSWSWSWPQRLSPLSFQPQKQTQANARKNMKP